MKMQRFLCFSHFILPANFCLVMVVKSQILNIKQGTVSCITDKPLPYHTLARSLHRFSMEELPSVGTAHIEAHVLHKHNGGCVCVVEEEVVSMWS